jgi:hypothetical protein
VKVDVVRVDELTAMLNEAVTAEVMATPVAPLVGVIAATPSVLVYPFVVSAPQPESANVRKLRKPRENTNFARPCMRMTTPNVILRPGRMELAEKTTRRDRTPQNRNTKTVTANDRRACAGHSGTLIEPFCIPPADRLTVFVDSTNCLMRVSP